MDWILVRTCMSLIQAYITPRLLHGLEATVLLKKDLAILDSFYKKLLRQVQGLPEATASEAIYLLIGTIPIEAVLHNRILSLFGSITRLKHSEALWQLTQRQLSLRADKRGSWFAQLAEIGSTYNIDIFHAFQFPWKKERWKIYCKQTIKDLWHLRLIKTALGKTSLSWLKLSLPAPVISKPNQLWACCSGKPFQVVAATTRARLLVGRHNLNAIAWRQARGDSPTCPLCDAGEENIVHFLVECKALNKLREDKLQDLLVIYSTEEIPPPVKPEEVCSAILNGDSYLINKARQKLWPHHHYVTLKVNSKKAHQLANLLCHKLYKERDFIINQKLMHSP